MPTDEELADYAARLAERLNLLPGCEHGHAWDTIDDVYVGPRKRIECRTCRDAARKEQQPRPKPKRKSSKQRRLEERMKFMTGKLDCHICGRPIREHEHCWCPKYRRHG